MQRFSTSLGLVASFVMSGAMVAGTVVFYTRIPSLTKHYMGELKTELTKVVGEMIPTKLTKRCQKCLQNWLPIKSPF